MIRYSGDPVWILAKYNGRCAGCKAAFKAGARVFYYPRTRQILSGACAQDAEREFQCQALDDAIAGREYTYVYTGHLN